MRIIDRRFADDGLLGAADGIGATGPLDAFGRNSSILKSEPSGFLKEILDDREGLGMKPDAFGFSVRFCCAEEGDAGVKGVEDMLGLEEWEGTTGAG
jgi:hypothetical protein